MRQVDPGERLDDRHNLPKEYLTPELSALDLLDEPISQWFLLARMALLS